ncbi:CAAX prenyl protease-related protein [Pseudoduganella ginsengisoli]|uniref:CAAX prenyl protease-related protein n=1 Tax=Pseudoduganella ginsengisoli TaxID=1462440 RepID=A0A6L6Q353_9BURK|nr:CAAX prenyl protease-related protein [Pseudoduganella ginsengisoli]MTW04035.1 CAAX prenyl protease-related protein [Pseudoduganella ginsengisoli]
MPASVPARVLPFAAYMAFIAIGDLLPAAGIATAEGRWLYAIKIAFVAALLWAYRRQYTELARFDVTARSGAAAVAVGLLVFVLWINLDAGWMQFGVSAGFDPRNDVGVIDWRLALIRIAGAALVVPIMEELFWRSFVLRWLESADFASVEPARVGVRALAITALLFGVEHQLWFAGIVAGLAYSWLYMRSGSLWVAVIAHGVTNGALGLWVLATGNWHYW